MEFASGNLLQGCVRRSQNKITKFVNSARQGYLNELKQQPKPVAPLQRASARFATVYAAGSLAIWLKVLDWDRDELRKAILKCQLDGLTKSTVATTEDSVFLAMGKKLRDHLKRNKSKFIDLRNGWLYPTTHEFGSVPGYVARHKGNLYWYLTAETLKSIIGSGGDASRYKRSLADDGRLDVSSGGRGGQRFVVERRIFKGKGKDGLQWVHAIKLKSVKTLA